MFVCLIWAKVPKLIITLALSLIEHWNSRKILKIFSLCRRKGHGSNDDLVLWQERSKAVLLRIFWKNLPRKGQGVSDSAEDRGPVAHLAKNHSIEEGRERLYVYKRSKNKVNNMTIVMWQNWEREEKACGWYKTFNVHIQKSEERRRARKKRRRDSSTESLSASESSSSSEAGSTTEDVEDDVEDDKKGKRTKKRTRREKGRKREQEGQRVEGR